MTTFWMVYVDGGGNPTFKHLSLEQAQLEAERLARANPGSKVYVLKALGVCQVKITRWENLEE